MEPLTTDYGVSLLLKESCGSIFLCQFDAPLEPYLRYMNAVLLHASRTPQYWASTRMQHPPCGLANSISMPVGWLTTGRVSCCLSGYWMQEPPVLSQPLVV